LVKGVGVGEGVGEGINVIIGVGWVALLVTPENNETQLLKITSTQHKMRANADEGSRRLDKKVRWKL
jgi:hypothetical protein